MLDVGIPPLDVGGYWMGGRYYLQHLVRCVAALPPEERAAIHDVYWNEVAPIDPFAEIRPFMSGRRVIAFPGTLLGRVARKAKRTLRNIRDARDLFAGIDVTFPLPLIENQGIPYVFWLPDFQHEHLKHFYAPEHYQSSVAMYDAYVAGAARIVVSSEFGLKDFARFYPQRAADATVLRFCSVPSDEWWRVDPVAFTKSIGLDAPYFVVSNQFTENKNHLMLVEAVDALRRRGRTVHVACTGSDYDFRGMNYFGRVQEQVRARGLESQIHFLGLLPREQQIAVVRRSVAVVQPSRFEGWSTGIEDAKAIGKPVIASEFPVHREQLIGRKAWFAGMDDIEAWADAMADALDQRSPGPHLDEERDARPLLEQAMDECGRTFVNVARAATAS